MCGFLFSDLAVRWGAAGALLLAAFGATSEAELTEFFMGAVLTEATVFSHATNVLDILAVATDVPIV